VLSWQPEEDQIDSAAYLSDHCLCDLAGPSELDPVAGIDAIAAEEKMYLEAVFVPSFAGG